MAKEGLWGLHHGQGGLAKDAAGNVEGYEIFIKGVPETATSESLAGFFAEAGPIEGEPRLQLRDGMGWITFRTEAAMSEAVSWSGCWFESGRLRVRPAKQFHTGIRPSVQMQGTHTPALCTEVVEKMVRPNTGGVYVDGTFGRGGHSRAMLAAMSPAGRLHAFDMDPEALVVGKQLMASDPRFTIHHAPFGTMGVVLSELGVEPSGVFMDLGISSPQFDNAGRGFKVESDGPLDLRFDQTKGVPASEFLQRVEHTELVRIIAAYGETGDSAAARRIADAICLARSAGTLPERTREFAALVAQAKGKEYQAMHPAKMTFQALRVHLNDEFKEIKRGIDAAFEILQEGGRIGLLTWKHSECAVLVESFRQLEAVRPAEPLLHWYREQPGAAPLEAGHALEMDDVVRPSNRELAENSRSRSALLHVLRKKRGTMLCELERLAYKMPGWASAIRGFGEPKQKKKKSKRPEEEEGDEEEAAQKKKKKTKKSNIDEEGDEEETNKKKTKKTKKSNSDEEGDEEETNKKKTKKKKKRKSADEDDSDAEEEVTDNKRDKKKTKKKKKSKKSATDEDEDGEVEEEPVEKKKKKKKKAKEEQDGRDTMKLESRRIVQPAFVMIGECGHCGSAHTTKRCTFGASLTERFLPCSSTLPSMACFWRRFLVPLGRASAPDFDPSNPRGSGRADVGVRCVSAAAFRSQGLRHSTQVCLSFEASGHTLTVSGSLARGLVPDESRLAVRLRTGLDGLLAPERCRAADPSTQPDLWCKSDLRGVEAHKRTTSEALESALTTSEARGIQEGRVVMLVLDADGIPMSQVRDQMRSGDPVKGVVVVVGDHRGLSESELVAYSRVADAAGAEVLRVSLGGHTVLASHAIVILQHYFDTMMHECEVSKQVDYSRGKDEKRAKQWWGSSR